MAFATYTDVRKLLPKVPNNETQNACITSAIEAAELEINVRLSRYINLNKASANDLPAIKQISAYLGASLFLSISMSYTNSNEETSLSKYYRDLAEKIIAEVMSGSPMYKNDGTLIDVTPTDSARAGVWTGYYDAKTEFES